MLDSVVRYPPSVLLAGTKFPVEALKLTGNWTPGGLVPGNPGCGKPNCNSDKASAIARFTLTPSSTTPTFWAPAASFASAAINWCIKISAAFPPAGGVFKISTNCDSVYDTPAITTVPLVNMLAGKAWCFQNPWVAGQPVAGGHATKVAPSNWYAGGVAAGIGIGVEKGVKTLVTGLKESMLPPPVE